MADTTGTGYPGRRAAANHDYIHNLNVIPSPPQQQQNDFFDMDKELLLFTNAEFMDFDAGHNVNNVSQNLKFDATAMPTTTTAAQQQPTSNETVRNTRPSASNEHALYHFFNADFRVPSFPEYPMGSTANSHPIYANVPPQMPSQTPFSAEQRPNHYQNMNLGAAPSTMAAATPTSTNIPNGSFQLHQPPVPQEQHMVQPSMPSHPPSSATHSRTPSFTTIESTGPEPVGQKEDRRRRNTAASARFRVKKKERERNMEKNYKDVMTRNEKLEARLAHLETENVWLRNLITEKSGLSLADKDLSKVLGASTRESNNSRNNGGGGAGEP